MNRDKGRSQRSVILGSGWYDRAVNTLLPNAKFKLRDNEYHSILYTKDGFHPASFMGPNTDLMGKIKEVAKLKEIAKNKSDYRVNIYTGQIPIQAKMKLEDLGVVGDQTFASYGGLKDDEIPIAKAKLKELELQGYGKKKKTAWMKHVAKCKKQHPNMPYKDILKIASKSYKK